MSHTPLKKNKLKNHIAIINPDYLSFRKNNKIHVVESREVLYNLRLQIKPEVSLIAQVFLILVSLFWFSIALFILFYSIPLHRESVFELLTRFGILAASILLGYLAISRVFAHYYNGTSSYHSTTAHQFLIKNGRLTVGRIDRIIKEEQGYKITYRFKKNFRLTKNIYVAENADTLAVGQQVLVLYVRYASILL